MNTISTDGVSISYQVSGKGAPALVFVHGWCCDKSYWDPQVSYFDKDHEVIAVDLAGHGDSGADRQEWTIPAFGADVVSVIRQLALDKVILIGHSMGGPVIVDAARRIPEKLFGLVGVDTFQDLDRKTRREGLQERLDKFHKDFVGTSRGIIGTMFLDSSDPALVAKITEDMSSAPPHVGIGATAAMSSYDTAGAMEDIKVPIRCICSDYRPFDLEAARRHARDFEVTFMSGVGHFVMLEDEPGFNRILEKIIKELTGVR